MLKAATNQGIRFLVYTDTTKVLQNYWSSKVMCDVVAGGFAGFCSVMANNPLDVIKTRLQGGDAHLYKGVSDCAKKIIAEQGMMGFYSGVVPRLSRVVLDVALTFSIFGALKRQIQAYILANQKE